MSEHQPEDARRFLPIIWRNRLSILLLILVGATLASVLSLLKPVTYSASAKLILANDAPFQPVESSTSSGDPARYVANQVDLITSATVLTSASKALPDHPSLEHLRSQIRAAAPATSSAITVTASDKSGAAAANVVNAVSDAYRSFVRADVQESAATAQANGVGGSSAAQIAARARAYGDGVAVAERARAEDATTGSRKTIVLLGGILGAVAGVAYALWKDARALLVRRPGNSFGVAEKFDAPLIGEVPKHAPATRADAPAGLATAPGDITAYRLLSVALDYALRQAQCSTVLVVAAQHSSGVSTTALNVAVASVTEGRRLVLVDAHTQRPDLTRLANLKRSTALVNLADPNVALHDVAGVWSPASRVDLVVIPAGSVGGGIQAAEQARLAFDRLTATGALVLVDGPPLSTPEGLALAGRVDGVLLVAPTSMPDEDIAYVQDTLRVVRTPLVGVVIGHPVARRAMSRPLHTALRSTTPAKT